MQKAEREGINIGPVNGFSFVGDPGCDGLGVEIMSIFNTALRESGGDFVLVGGDIVPNGTNHFYENVTSMVDRAIQKPVYMLAGNHDTLNYETFFGRKNYFLYNDKLLLIVLDDSDRVFSGETLAALRRALEFARDNIVIAFHIPPPNRVTKNTVNDGEWEKVSGIIAPFRQKVRYILCGHIHSYFEDEIDGFPLIVTGGGGGGMDEIPGIKTPYYHFVDFTFDPDGKLRHTLKFIDFKKAPVPLAQPVQDSLARAFEGECQAHVRYRIYADDARKNNKPGLEKLFRAASDSEFHHARNFFYAMNEFSPVHESVAESIKNESHEVDEVYPDAAELARRHGSELAAYAFDDAREAEKVHLRLFTEAQTVLAENDDIPGKRYLTCTSCGLTFSVAGDVNIKFCPVCGAPIVKIKEVA